MRRFITDACIYAAMSGHVSLLENLHKHEVDMGVVNNSATQLYKKDSIPSHAVKNGQYAVAEFLLEVGARSDVPDDQVPANIAVEMGKVDFLRLFHRHALTLWIENTPRPKLHIHYAIREGNVNAIQLLVKEASLNINEVDGVGQSPFHLAVESD